MRLQTGIPSGYVDEFNFTRLARSLHVALIARVVAFNGVTVDIRPRGVMLDLNDSPIDYPIIQNVPIVTLRAGGFAITFPIKEGDEGIAIFCDKNIDFTENGSFVNRNYHYHELTDAVFIPGCVYTLSPISDWDRNKVVIRNEANSARISIDPDGNIDMTTDKKLNVLADEGIDIKTNGRLNVDASNITIGTNVDVKTGGVTATGDVKAGDISLQEHTHSYIYPQHPAGQQNTTPAQ